MQQRGILMGDYIVVLDARAACTRKCKIRKDEEKKSTNDVSYLITTEAVIYVLVIEKHCRLSLLTPYAGCGWVGSYFF